MSLRDDCDTCDSTGRNVIDYGQYGGGGGAWYDKDEPAYPMTPDRWADVKDLIARFDTNEKPSNPKDLIGTDKLPLHLVPGTSKAYQCLGHLEGLLKYGGHNWREAGVRCSIYMDALERHYEKFKNGEWEAEDTGVPHLGSMLACIGIIVDAYECGKLIDDRPKQAPVAALIDRFAGKVKRLRELFKDKNPHHYLHEPEPKR